MIKTYYYFIPFTKIIICFYYKMQPIIQNQGITKTIINNNGNKDENEIKWNANYDGKKANIEVDLSKNCKKNKLRIELNNDDLANILGVRSIPIPLEQRLKTDFLSNMDTIMDSDSDSDSDSIMDIMELNSAQQLHTLDSQQLEDDINKLLHIKTIKPSVKSTYKPHPYLFRVKLPQSQEKISELYNKPKPRPKYRHKEITSSSQSSIKPNSKPKSKPETLTLSEMLFDPAFDLSAPPIQLKEPTHIRLPNVLSSLTPESLMLSSSTIPFQGKIRASTAKNGKSKAKAKAKTKTKPKAKKGKSKNAYKTPAPKTYRVHLTSNKGSRKSKTKSNSKSNSALGIMKQLGF